MPPKRRLGPDRRQPPRLDEERSERRGDELDDAEVIEDVAWRGATPGPASDVEVLRSLLAHVTLTGLELDAWRLVDVELVDCELSGTVLTGARWERVVLRRCRMSGLVATELKAEDLRMEACKADGAWLRGAVLDRCEVVDTDLSRADLHGAQVTRTAFRRCDLREVDVTESRFQQVSLHGSSLDGLKGAASLSGCSIGSDQVVPLALPILASRSITVDDDPPDLVD